MSLWVWPWLTSQHSAPAPSSSPHPVPLGTLDPPCVSVWRVWLPKGVNRDLPKTVFVRPGARGFFLIAPLPRAPGHSSKKLRSAQKIPTPNSPRRNRAGQLGATPCVRARSVDEQAGRWGCRWVAADSSGRFLPPRGGGSSCGAEDRAGLSAPSGRVSQGGTRK